MCVNNKASVIIIHFPQRSLARLRSPPGFLEFRAGVAALSPRSSKPGNVGAQRLVVACGCRNDRKMRSPSFLLQLLFLQQCHAKNNFMEKNLGTIQSFQAHAVAPHHGHMKNLPWRHHNVSDALA